MWTKDDLSDVVKQPTSCSFFHSYYAQRLYFWPGINTRKTGHLGPVKMADVLNSTDVIASCLHNVSDVHLTLTSDTHMVKNVGTE